MGKVNIFRQKVSETCLSTGNRYIFKKLSILNDIFLKGTGVSYEISGFLSAGHIHHSQQLCQRSRGETSLCTFYTCILLWSNHFTTLHLLPFLFQLFEQFLSYVSHNHELSWSTVDLRHSNTVSHSVNLL